MKYSERKYPLQKETYQIIGICMEIHRILGKGLLEIVYKDAIEYEFRNIKFLIHRDYIFEKDDEIQLTCEGYAKANLIVDLLNEEIPYKKSFFDYVKNINLVGWDLLTCPEKNNRIVKFNGIPFDT